MSLRLFRSAPISMWIIKKKRLILIKYLFGNGIMRLWHVRVALLVSLIFMLCNGYLALTFRGDKVLFAFYDWLILDWYYLVFLLFLAIAYKTNKGYLKFSLNLTSLLGFLFTVTVYIVMLQFLNLSDPLSSSAMDIPYSILNQFSLSLVFWIPTILLPTLIISKFFCLVKSILRNKS